MDRDILERQLARMRLNTCYGLDPIIWNGRRIIINPARMNGKTHLTFKMLKDICNGEGEGEMNAYTCIHNCFTELATSRGYKCKVSCRRNPYPYLRGDSYVVCITDPLTHAHAQFIFDDEDMRAFSNVYGLPNPNAAKNIIEVLINRIRKENEKMNIGYVPINSRCTMHVDIGLLKIKNVIFNPPATIVFWTDGTKTVVKTQNNEEFDPEKGLAMAYFKKMHGNKGHYFEEIKKWTEKYEDPNNVKYTDEELTALFAAKNDSTPGNDKCQST